MGVIFLIFSLESGWVSLQLDLKRFLENRFNLMLNNLAALQIF